MNVVAIYIANAIEMLLLICVAAGNTLFIKEQAKRNKCLLMLALVTAFSCILDPISASADGQPGEFSCFVIYATNTVLYIIGLVTAVLWVILMADYIKIKISKTHRTIIGVFFFAALTLIIANIFTPLLFKVNENNMYERTGGLYIIYAASYFGFLLDVVLMYFIKKRESGGIKFFPIWAYIVPIVTGMIIQNLFYGVSTIAPFMTISIVSMMISFQNNLLYKDQLTDLYNRYYLSVLERKFEKGTDMEYSVIMLDVNDFKSINDICGHDAGDEALIKLSKILISIVDMMGEVIRYAGDEFIIILNSHDDAFIEEIISKIHTSLSELENTSTMPYKLSVATGWCRFRFGEKTLNEFITEADKHMYINKQEHYKLYPKNR